MKFLVLVLVFFAVAGGGAYYYLQKYATSPSPQETEITQNIFKYPNAGTWNVDNSPTFCLSFFDPKCASPSRIDFQTYDGWNNVYAYYKADLTNKGWKTNSVIITSIPTSVIFYNDDDCRIELTPKSDSNYNFSTYCADISQ